MSDKIIQIVPRLQPSICGVGDYALRLAREWQRQFNIESQFLVLDPDWKGEPSVDGFRVQRLEERTSASLTRTLAAMDAQETPFLLHYVGYGYARRGAPVWLANGMRAWLHAHPECAAGTFFHELFAFGPPWTSAFWLNPIQRWVCRELARAVQFRFTNRAVSAIALDRMAGFPKSPAQVLPIFSSLGEPQSVERLSERLPQMVVYGRIARSKTQQAQALRQLRGVLQQLGLKKVVSFGPVPCPQQGLDVPVENRGRLAVSEVSALLTASRAGYLDYPVQYVAKSSVFAAFCAHGLVPVLLNCDAESADGLSLNQHFLTVDSLTAEVSSQDRLQEIASNARQWYRGHSIANVASSIAVRFLVSK